VRPLAPSPAWTLVTPYCKRTRPGRGTNTKAAGFPPLSRPSPATSLPPFALGLTPTHLGWGTRRHFTRRPRDPPGLETPTIIDVVFFDACMRCTRLCPLKSGVTVCHLVDPAIQDSRMLGTTALAARHALSSY
jgi:hypothetical protein